MNSHSCNAAIVTCIDFRFQPSINQWINENFQPKTYDRIAFAMEQVAISHRLHHIKKVVLINHEDCGAYEEEGNDERHAEDLNNASEKIKFQFPKMEVETYYLHLNGAFDKITL